jgi:hypothetical protein
VTVDSKSEPRIRPAANMGDVISASPRGGGARLLPAIPVLPRPRIIENIQYL